ncbi:ATP-binding cassette domain-containing protein [bacterium]|nr:ATP-binding cassette domain-containing protein [bacterium]
MRFGDAAPVLADVTTEIASGEFVALLGPSGCGKSTLLRLFAGLLQPNSGRLTLAGKPPQQARKTETRVAFVFQDPTLLPWRTVTDNIRLPLELQKQPRSTHAEPISSALELIGLTAADARKRPRKLSGGMRMRVSLARALVTDPKVLLLDEPFAALDDVLRQQLNEDLVRIWQQKQWTGVFVTHNVSEAVFLSQRVLVMSTRPGRIMADVRIPFGYPRGPELRAEPEFARLTVELSQRLREVAR